MRSFGSSIVHEPSANTIVVIFRGRLVARLNPNEVTPEALGTYMTGAAVQEV